MFGKEGELYRFVKEFLIEKKGCSKDKTHYTYEEGAFDGKTLSLSLFKRNIEPDVYGITDENVVFMAEGKLTYEGKALDEAILQGVSYQRFAHYVYIFFPSYIFSEDPLIKEHVQDLCAKNNLGLLLVSENGTVNEVLEPRLSKFFTDERIWNQTLYNIERARERIVKLLLLGEEARGIGIVHLAMLRDVCYLMGDKEWKKEEFIHFLLRERDLLHEYRERNKNSTLSLYDWSYKKPLLEDLTGKRKKKKKAESIELEEKFSKIIHEAVKTLAYLDLCQIKNGSVKLTGIGLQFKNLIEKYAKKELFTRKTSQINDLFVTILLCNLDTRGYITNLCKEIAHGDPQPNYLFWCPKCGLIKRSWELRKSDWDKIKEIYEIEGIFKCFKCGNKRVPLTRAIFLPLKGLELNYRLNILLEEAKVLEKKRFHQLSKEQQKELEAKNLKPPINTIYWVLGENAPYRGIKK